MESGSSVESRSGLIEMWLLLPGLVCWSYRMSWTIERAGCVYKA